MNILYVLIGLVVGYLIFRLSSKKVKTDVELQSELQKLQKELNEQKSTFLNEKEQLINQKEEDFKNREKSLREDLSNQKEEDFKNREKSIRDDAIKKSKSVMLGKMWEQIVPYYRPTDFKFIPSDARFLGSPVDFIIFNGASETNIEEVIFLEIKTAKSRLNSQQVKLKKLIDSLKSKVVRWETITIPIEIDKSDTVD